MKQIITILTLLFTINSFSQQLAFPCAKGAGAYSTGGRGGQVIHVTTLAWTGPGSLKEAITTPGKRTIVFDVSGEIDASSEGAYSSMITGSAYDSLTIAGQTAPNGGISIRTSEFMFSNVSNVVVRYIRFRHVGVPLPGNHLRDAVSILGGNNVIFDHCSFSHGVDEAASFANSTGTMYDFTVQNCFFSR